MTLHIPPEAFVFVGGFLCGLSMLFAYAGYVTRRR